MKKIFTSYIYIFLLTLFSFSFSSLLTSCGGGSSGSGGTYNAAPTPIPEGENSGYGSGPGASVWYVANDIKSIGLVYSLEYSPDGKKLAVGTQGSIIIYDVSNGYAQLKNISITSLKPAGNRVRGLAFNPDGTKLVSILYDGNMQVWNTSNYSLISTVSAYSYEGYSVELTSNGEIGLTFGSNGSVIGSRSSKVWDMTVSPPNKLATVSNGAITSLLRSAAISPDGKYFAFGGDNKISIVDISNPASPNEIVDGHSIPGGSVDAIAFHPDGKTLIAGQSVWLRYFNLTTLPTMTLIKTKENGGSVWDLSYSQDGSMLSVAGGVSKSAMVWDGEDAVQSVDGNEYGFICSTPSYVWDVTTKSDGTEFAFDVGSGFQVWRKYEY